MKVFRRKLLSFLIVVVLALSVMPATVFANTEAVTVYTEQELRDAIDAIPTGGSGEITIRNVYMYLTEMLYIEDKDVTFNLYDATMVTAKDEEDGFGQPVIFGYGTNITINMDDNSSMEALGHTGNMSVVRIDNSTDWNEAEQAYEKTFTLTVNGGRFTCAEENPEEAQANYVFAAVPGTRVVLTDVVCNGRVAEIDFESIDINVPGELIINGGKFTNDVSDYVADGKSVFAYGENYYVRDKEMTDEFCAVLSDGKLIFNYARPTGYDEAAWLIAEEFGMVNPDFYFDPEGFNEDFSKVELGLYWGTAKEEFHLVDVVWNYDATVLQTAQAYIEKFPEDRSWFNVTDLELVNYWAYRNPDSEIDSLANYSGELKAILGNSNFLYTIEYRGGADDVFYTERIGSAKLIHDGKVYYATTMIGARAEHAIYIPESTAVTKDALMVAAQKRIDDYIGENKIKITAADETVTEYYENELANYDLELATAQRELAEAQAMLDAELAKDSEYWDWNLISQCQFKIMECENEIQYIPQYKQGFYDIFQEGGDLYFLNRAAGDFFFNIEVLETGDTYKFVIIKDDDKLAVPTYATVDLNTNVSVSTDSTSVPLDTVIEVDKITEGTEYDRIIQILDVEENETFDIKLHSGSLDEYVTKLADGTFEVKIPVSESLKGQTLSAYYVDAQGGVTEHAVTVADGYAYFTTDHFSVYTLAAASAAPDGDVLYQALVNAAPGETVAMDANYDLSALEGVYIPAGVTLDLNGHTLTVNAAAAVTSTSAVIDSSNGRGGIKVAKDQLLFVGANTQLPLYDAAFGGYRFFTFESKYLQKDGETSNSTMFGMHLELSEQALALLADKESAGVDMIFRVESDVLVEPIDWVVRAQTLADYAQKQAADPDGFWVVVLTISGLDTLDSGTTLTVTASMVSTTTAVLGTSALDYTR